MKCKLERFYIESMLPEIVHLRFTRNMPIREPSAIRTTDEAINTDDISNTTNVFDARIEDLLMYLGKAKYFASLDLISGYWQMVAAEKDRSKTAFVTPSGIFQFTVVPYG
ncbi:hypothetical protein EVAR_76551_1 [Eumeta japonica]|uniref:Reverse transcriptase domain-containing protein n=1 Tax=Eumeta variegata TaxID=151549 RepID=A0A4C1T4V4_EUMVA|nr:hypothetical protein EVAR_76551_1 [Eumeta japonica]